MLVTTTETVPNKKVVEILGIATGSTVRTRNIKKDFFAGLKSLGGGELEAYTELLTQARQEASYRMIKNAKEFGANAILNVRYTTSEVMEGACEVLAYGTAVILD